jgi:hypothetical protein
MWLPEDPPRSGDRCHQPSEDDEDELDRTSKADHQTTYPRHGSDHDLHGRCSELGVPWVGKLVGVTPCSDDRIGWGPAQVDNPVGELGLLARWDEERNHPRTQISDRYRPGDQECSRVKCGAHTPGQHGADAVVQDHHTCGQGRRPGQHQDTNEERDRLEEPAHQACVFGVGACHPQFFDS